MPDTNHAYRIHKEDNNIVARFEDLPIPTINNDEVLIKAAYSSINYKDALAATGAGKILRRFPLIGGLDVSGEIAESKDSRFKSGDKVLVTGCGLGEEVDGGYAQFVRAQGDWVIPLPTGLNQKQAMAIGTAGFTAALGIHRLEHNDLRPDNGPVVVTGATGGVGSIAINMLKQRGYEVVAVTGKSSASDYLKHLGAASILLRQDIDYGKRPLESIQWQGAIDNVGGDMLTWLTRTTGWWGSIASIGLAGSHELHTTVMPFILRGVNLLGINSMATPRELRLTVWNRIARDLNPPALDKIASRTIKMAELPDAFQDYLDGKVQGRTVVEVDNG